MEGPEIQFAEATIDNGKFGTRTVRFETGRLAQQAGAPSPPTSMTTPCCCRPPPPAQPQGPVRLLPADGRRRGAHVRRGQDPRLVLPSRGSPLDRGDPHLPPDRPAAAPDLHQGPAQRGPGRHHGPGAQPRPPVRRAGDQRRVRLDPDLRPAVLRPDRWRARRAHRRPVGRVPELQRRRALGLRHGRRRPRRDEQRRLRRRRDHDGRGRVHRGDLGPGTTRASRRRPRRSWPRASRPPRRSSPRCARPRPSSPRRPPSRSRTSRSSWTTRTTSTPPSRPPPPPT